MSNIQYKKNRHIPTNKMPKTLVLGTLNKKVNNYPMLYLWQQQLLLLQPVPWHQLENHGGQVRLEFEMVVACDNDQLPIRVS
jgi:hypothetical protein